MRATSPSASAYVVWMPSARMAAASRPACALSVATIEVNATVSAAESIPIILTFLAASSIGLPSAANCVGAITSAVGFDATAISSIRIWPLTSGLGLGTQFDNFDAEILTGLARSRDHGLPIE